MDTELDNVSAALSRLYTTPQLQQVAHCMLLPDDNAPQCDSRREWLDYIRESCMAADDPDGACRLVAVHAKKQREQLDVATVDEWWLSLLDDQTQLEPLPDWTWEADKMFTKRYKFIVADCVTNQTVDDLLLPLPAQASDGEDVFAALQTAVEQSCRQNARACTQFLALSTAVQNQSAAKLVEELTDSQLKHRRIELVQQSQMKGSVFASVWEDLPLCECLWALLLTQVGPFLEGLGFTADRFGFQTCQALLKHTTVCAAELEGAVSEYMHGAADRFDFQPAAVEPSNATGNFQAGTLVVAFSSMGSGLVRHEFRGSLKVPHSIQTTA